MALAFSLAHLPAFTSPITGLTPAVCCAFAAVVSLDLQGNAVTDEEGDASQYSALLSLSLADFQLTALPHAAEQVQLHVHELPLICYLLSDKVT
jgi:hypothetical protein